MKVKNWLSVLEGNFKVKIGEEPASIVLFSKKDIIDVYGDAELQEVIIDYEKRCAILKIAVHSQCASYRVRKEKRLLSQFEQGVYYGKTGKEKTYDYYDKPYCMATRECDTCSCGGDKSKCDFYKKFRKNNK